MSVRFVVFFVFQVLLIIHCFSLLIFRDFNLDLIYFFYKFYFSSFFFILWHYFLYWMTMAFCWECEANYKGCIEKFSSNRIPKNKLIEDILLYDGLRRDGKNYSLVSAASQVSNHSNPYLEIIFFYTVTYFWNLGLTFLAS